MYTPALNIVCSSESDCSTWLYRAMLSAFVRQSADCSPFVLPLMHPLDESKSHMHWRLDPTWRNTIARAQHWN